MPRQDEALSYVPDSCCHVGFRSVSLTRTQPLPLTSPLTMFDLLFPPEPRLRDRVWQTKARILASAGCHPPIDA